MFVINGRFLTQKASGVHRYAFEICNELHNMGIDFYVVTPQNINPDYVFKFKTVACGTIQNGHLWEQISLPRFLKQQGNPLLISFTGCGPLFYRNQIITIHDLSHEVHPEWFSKNYYRYYHFMLPRIARKSHAILTVSEFSKQEIVSLFNIDANKINVVNSNVPFRSKPSKEELLSYSKPDSVEDYIIAVSNMDPRKNFSRLIQAFKQLKNKSIKLYIIGMKQKAFNDVNLEESSNIYLPGFIDDEKLKEMYQNALLSVYPSLYEGFGLPPLESMTFGCPVIVSDIPALKEISEDAALYVDPTNINDITSKIEELLQNDTLRAELRNKGFEQIQKYSWSNSAKQVLAIAQKYS